MTEPETLHELNRLRSLLAANADGDRDTRLRALMVVDALRAKLLLSLGHPVESVRAEISSAIADGLAQLRAGV